MGKQADVKQMYFCLVLFVINSVIQVATLPDSLEYIEQGGACIMCFLLLFAADI